MGLVVSAFSGLVTTTDAVSPLTEGFYDPQRRIVRLDPPADGVEQADGIQPGAYAYSDAILCFEAGPYSHFSQWREWLAKIAGYAPTEHPDYRHCPHLVTSWLAKTGPLHAYLNSSDCEGVFGAGTCDRIVRDFADLRPLAVSAEPEAADLFDRWSRLFAFAARDGAVVYH